MSAEDAYFAGIIDGEGCISFYSRNGGRSSGKTKQIKIDVCMTAKNVVVALQRRYGGSVHKRKKPHPHLKQQFAWAASAKMAKACLEAILPYLIEKREQALVALAAREYQEANVLTHKTRGDHNPEPHYKKLLEFDEQLRALKRVEFL